jgi:peptidoglycan DL-endopeptidase CwlO
MFARGQARAGRIVRATRALWLSLTLAILISTALTVQSASATSLSTLQAEAKAAQVRLNQLYAVSEQKIQAYDQVNSRYLKTRTQLRSTQYQLGIARANLTAARAQLAADLTRAYKAGSPDPIMYLLAARSFNELVDQVAILGRTSNSTRQLVLSIGRYRTQVKTQAALLKRQVQQLQIQKSQAKAAADAAQRSVSSAAAYKAHLGRRIQSILDAQAAAAREAAARAAAAAATGGGSSPPPGSIPVPPSSSLGGQAVAIAEQYLGVSYVYGGASPSGFDCSGLVMYVYGQLGVSLPHNALAQYNALPHVPLSDLQPGDLVFFYGFGHVAIYVGNGIVIHAPHTGASVEFASMSSMGPIAAARVPG